MTPGPKYLPCQGMEWSYWNIAVDPVAAGRSGICPRQAEAWSTQEASSDMLIPGYLDTPNHASADRQTMPLATHVVVLAPRPTGQEHREARMKWLLMKPTKGLSLAPDFLSKYGFCWCCQTILFCAIWLLKANECDLSLPRKVWLLCVVAKTGQLQGLLGRLARRGCLRWDLQERWRVVEQKVVQNHLIY